MTPLEVNSGEPLEIDITDYVLTVEGRSPRLTVEDKVTALEGSREVTSTTTITYTSNAGYVGPASVTFEVTDGSGPDDPDGSTALLTLPVSVLPPENMPPEMTGTPTLDVAAGEEAAVDLARFASDPDEDPLTFRVAGEAPGVALSMEGSTLQAQANPDVPKGTVVSVPVTVTDGEHPPVEAAATLTVVASTRPLVRANTDTLDDATRVGRARSPCWPTTRTRSPTRRSTSSRPVSRRGRVSRRSGATRWPSPRRTTSSASWSCATASRTRRRTRTASSTGRSRSPCSASRRRRRPRRSRRSGRRRWC
ncbi:Ig-like domain-containing protein [Cellulosimicrobium sp. CUA-896]|uniref:Ig-like domain-containing protein n=1 Tax=Cellulosimicrobium sp. CUA-896 TaxID=1517881 RepID=UPI0021008A61|nr:Ig-like domain-containing protein [Cellulosimicrobium sp. CUA-896]